MGRAAAGALLLTSLAAAAQACRACRVLRARRRLRELPPARTVVLCSGSGASGAGGSLASGSLLAELRGPCLLGCPSGARGTRAERLEAEPLELSDFDSVQSFVERAHSFLAEGDGPRLLINYAGVSLPPHKGAAEAWRVNFFGPFLLTELLGRLRHSRLPELRVLHVSSRLEAGSKFDADSLDALRSGGSTEEACADSRRAVLLWTSVRAQSLALTKNMYMHCVAADEGASGSRRWLRAVWRWLGPAEAEAAEELAEVMTLGLQPRAVEVFGRSWAGAAEEDLVLERMSEKRLGTSLAQLATERTQLDQRALGYER